MDEPQILIEHDPYERYRNAPHGCRDILVACLIFIMLALFLVFCSGCKTQRIVQTIEKEKIVEIRTRDTAIVTQADSASLFALLRCDSAYNVVMDELVTMQGERIKAQANTKQTSKGLLITLDCKEDSLRHELQLRDSIISNMTARVEEVKEQYVSDYYKNTSKGFWVLLVILLALVGWRVYKLYIKIKTGGIL